MRPRPPHEEGPEIRENREHVHGTLRTSKERSKTIVRLARPLVPDVAVVLDLAADGACRRASIVLGAAAQTPWRARAAEAVLNGKPVDPDLAAKTGRAAIEGATPLSANAYKAPMFEALEKRAILKAAAS